MPNPVRTLNSHRIAAVAVLLLAGILVEPGAAAQDQDPPPPQRVRTLPGPRGIDGPGPIGRPPVPGGPDDAGGPDVGDGDGGSPPPLGGAVGDDEEDEEDVAPAMPESRQKPPILDPNAKVSLDFVDTPLTDLVKYMAEISGRNFILTDDLKGNITIISHKQVSVRAAYEAFLSALESAGYTTVAVGEITKVVPTSGAGNVPLPVNLETNNVSDIPYTDNFVTQVIQLENVSVGDISSVVKELAGKSAKVIAYAPTNTLIITDAATNIRRVYKIVSQLDVAAPKSKLEIIPITNATAEDIKKIIDDLYGTDSSSSSSSSSSASDTAASRRSRRARRNQEVDASAAASETKIGSEGKYIEKIISDERTNSLIVMANEAALETIKTLIAQLDVDVDPSSRAQIHVIYLEHAKSEDVAQVLANLSEGGSSSSSRSSTSRSATGRGRTPIRPPGAPPMADDGDSDGGGAVAAFDSGVRITSDENTNSLVIIATPDQFDILKQVIDRLDIRRKQVFVQAVILEMASDDSLELGVGYHMGVPGTDGSLSIASAQLNGSSLGLSTDLLTGMAMGVFGAPVDVTVSDGKGGYQALSVPAFGIALNALQSNSAVNILGTPEILTMDNEEAKIIVGRNIPFPVSTGRDNNNNPIISYQREDVATTLKVTPQINESNFVTLEVFQEVTEVEEDSQGLDTTTAGFITSKRSAETTVIVKDNQTIVIGGLIGATDTEVETKIPILGDLPLIGALFRGKRNSSRKTNLLIFLTPHVINEPADLEEVYRVKMAQRQEFIDRFYGKTRDEQEEQLGKLLRYSMNQIDEPSPWRTKQDAEQNWDTIDGASRSETHLGGTVITEERKRLGVDEAAVVEATGAAEPEEPAEPAEPVIDASAPSSDQRDGDVPASDDPPGDD